MSTINKTTASYWLVPHNPKYYDLEGALLANNKEVFWKNDKHSLQTGDTVFIYVTSPEKRIKYMMTVAEDGIEKSQIPTHLHGFWNNMEMFNKTSIYCRLKLEIEMIGDALSREHLKEHGLKGNIQGSQTVKSEQLLEYILVALKK